MGEQEKKADVNTTLVFLVLPLYSVIRFLGLALPISAGFAGLFA